MTPSESSGATTAPAVAADDSTDEGSSSDVKLPEKAVVSESVKEGKESPWKMGDLDFQV